MISLFPDLRNCEVGEVIVEIDEDAERWLLDNRPHLKAENQPGMVD